MSYSQIQHQLNHMNPAARSAALGDMLAAIMVAVNANTAAINAVVSGLNTNTVAGHPYADSAAAELAMPLQPVGLVQA
jgi:hypothetical protein